MEYPDRKEDNDIKEGLGFRPTYLVLLGWFLGRYLWQIYFIILFTGEFDCEIEQLNRQKKMMALIKFTFTVRRGTWFFSYISGFIRSISWSVSVMNKIVFLMFMGEFNFKIEHLNRQKGWWHQLVYII